MLNKNFVDKQEVTGDVARKCCWEVLKIELLVVIWIAGRQACCLAWMNFNLRSLNPPPSHFSFFSPLVFVIIGSVGEP